MGTSKRPRKAWASKERNEKWAYRGSRNIMNNRKGQEKGRRGKKI
jgi:hypothetical protein